MKYKQGVSKVTIIGLLFSLFAFSAPVHASVNDFVINNFDATYSLNRDDPQGALTIDENISLTFHDYNHGIERAIPDIYGQDATNPKIIKVERDGVAEPYSLYTSNHNLVARIGDANKTITGDHQYHLVYKVVNVITFYQDHAELYWDTNGTGWSQPFTSVHALFKVEGTKFSASPNPLCFTGSQGSTAQLCTVESTDQTVTALTTNGLRPGENLTVVMSLPLGYFTPISSTQRLLDKIRHFSPAIIYSVLIIGIVLKVYAPWRKYGKDYKKNKIIAPAFEAPKNISPLLAGYVYSQTVIPKYLSATIVDLAIRGYIKIVESDHKVLLRNKTDYILELQTTDQKDLKDQEIAILTALFDTYQAKATVNLTAKKNKLYTVLQSLTKSVSAAATTAGYYEAESEAQSKKAAIYLLPLIVLLVVGHVLFAFITFGLVVGYIGLLLVILMTSTMRRRSHMGLEVVRQLDGLKLYLSTAEKERFKMLQGANAELADNAHEPVRDVKLFEKLLPFAIIFGVEKSWANAFADLYTQPPEWYSGNWTTFNAVILTQHLASTMNTVNTAFSAPSSSGSSGFSGGGFSGGGGGGGGGGGW